MGVLFRAGFFGHSRKAHCIHFFLPFPLLLLSSSNYSISKQEGRAGGGGALSVQGDCCISSLSSFLIRKKKIFRGKRKGGRERAALLREAVEICYFPVKLKLGGKEEGKGREATARLKFLCLCSAVAAAVAMCCAVCVAKREKIEREMIYGKLDLLSELGKHTRAHF